MGLTSLSGWIALGGDELDVPEQIEE